MRVLVQTQEKRGAAVDHVVEVAFQFASLETLDGVARELLEFGIAFVAQVVTGQLVGPRLVGESGDGAAIDLILLGAELILIEENRETLVEAWVVWIAIDLTAQNAERGRDLFHFHQASQV